MACSSSLGMICYSVQPRDQIFVKGYEFWCFARNTSKNLGKNISKNLSSKCSQKLLDHATNAIKTASKRMIQKTSEATGDLFGNKFVNKITRVSKTSPKNNSEINEERMLRERFIPPELRHKIIDDLRLKEENYWSKIENYLLI